ncbi:hypothetical protein H6P81_019226 [Aristolochia fimbriata]|uniref:Uncharacterized protein n=1 Tax=Aristolochia fimbriata TaxID=158543 RepID=A0AAV7DU56_ARIFI|nr:hypothetical protein H6P81_019226 [Aristolochia fimbriata]
MRWEKVQANTRPRETPEGKKSPGRIGGILGPGRRWGHTCNSVKGGRFLYVFGGYGKDNCQTNDVHVFDTLKQTWSKPMVKGTPPSPRDSHSCTTVGNNLFVFGGTDGKYPLNDLHVLDTSTNTWVRPNMSGPVPAPREGHSAALIDKRLFIFGGCGKSCNDPEELYYNDLYILDTESFIWKHAVTSGHPPSARDSHTCSSWKNKIIVVGGEDSSDYYLSDAHVLDADTLVWMELQTSGQMLTPRAGHSTVAFGKHLFVFGGFTDDRNLYDDLHLLNVETGVWSKVESAGGGPTARFSVAGDCLDPRRGVLVFMGGCNQSLDALEDMYYLYTGMLVQNEEEEPRHEKYSLRRELKKKCQEQYLLPQSRSENFEGFSKLEVMPNAFQPATFANTDQEGKQHVQILDLTPSEKVFHAKVTDSFHYGYTIETTIDGKPLRGILFSCKAGFGQAANESLSRKRASPEDDVKADERDEPKEKMIRVIDQEIKGSDHMQPQYAQGVESASQGSPMETVASDSNNSPLDVCQQQEDCLKARHSQFSSVTAKPSLTAFSVGKVVIDLFFSTFLCHGVYIE